MSGEDSSPQTPSDNDDARPRGFPITSLIREVSMKYWEPIILAAKTRLSLAALAILMLGVVELITVYNQGPVIVIIGFALVEGGIILIYWLALQEKTRSDTEIAARLIIETGAGFATVVADTTARAAQTALDIATAGGEAAASGLNVAAEVVAPPAHAALSSVGEVLNVVAQQAPKVIEDAAVAVASGAGVAIEFLGGVRNGLSGYVAGPHQAPAEPEAERATEAPQANDNEGTEGTKAPLDSPPG